MNWRIFPRADKIPYHIHPPVLIWGDRMSEEELLKAGVTAAKAGDKTKAAGLFAQVVKINPSSEAGWFYLAMCCPTAEQREYCLRRTLEINPNNTQARQKLQAMAKPAPPSTSPFIYDEN